MPRAASSIAMGSAAAPRALPPKSRAAHPTALAILGLVGTFGCGAAQHPRARVALPDALSIAGVAEMLPARTAIVVAARSAAAVSAVEQAALATASGGLITAWLMPTLGEQPLTAAEMTAAGLDAAAPVGVALIEHGSATTASFARVADGARLAAALTAVAKARETALDQTRSGDATVYGFHDREGLIAVVRDATLFVIRSAVPSRRDATAVAIANLGGDEALAADPLFVELMPALGRGADLAAFASFEPWAAERIAADDDAVATALDEAAAALDRQRQAESIVGGEALARARAAEALYFAGKVTTSRAVAAAAQALAEGLLRGLRGVAGGIELGAEPALTLVAAPRADSLAGRALAIGGDGGRAATAALAVALAPLLAELPAPLGAGVLAVEPTALAELLGLLGQRRGADDLGSLRAKLGLDFATAIAPALDGSVGFALARAPDGGRHLAVFLGVDRARLVEAARGTLAGGVALSDGFLTLIGDRWLVWSDPPTIEAIATVLAGGDAPAEASAASHLPADGARGAWLTAEGVLGMFGPPPPHAEEILAVDDDNADVPPSDEYVRLLGQRRMARALTAEGNAELAAAVFAQSTAAATAAVPDLELAEPRAPRGTGGARLWRLEGRFVAKAIPLPPPAVAAERAAKARRALDQIAVTQAQLERELIRIRARDVAAWDQQHPDAPPSPGPSR